MKVTIYPRIAAAKLPNLVPPAYRESVAELAAQGGSEYSVLLFAHTSRDVVHSPPVRKALRRLGVAAPGGIVAVGTVFTAEAIELLRGVGARIVAQRKGKWTDESARGRQP